MKMWKMFFHLFVWYTSATFTSAMLLKTTACDMCAMEQCSEVLSNCDSYIISGVCNCCFMCKEVSGSSSGSVARSKRLSEGSTGEVTIGGNSATEERAIHEDGGKITTRLQGNSSSNSSSSAQNLTNVSSNLTATPYQGNSTTVTLTEKLEILHQVLKDGSVVIQILTTNAPQEVLYCTLTQIPVPGSHVLATIAKTIMEAINEGAIYFSQTKFVAGNISFESLEEAVIEFIDKSFVKASSSSPNIANAIKEFLSSNRNLTELHPKEKVKAEPTESEIIIEEIQLNLRLSFKFIQDMTPAVLRKVYKQTIKNYAFPGSNILAELVDAIMTVANAVCRNALKSKFMEEKASWENLLESAKNDIIVGVKEGFKAGHEVINIIVEELKNSNETGSKTTSSTTHKDAASKSVFDKANLDKSAIVRPLINTFLQSMCEHLKYKDEIVEAPQRFKPPVSEFFTEVQGYIEEALDDVEKVVCTSRVLNETASYNELRDAVNLVNNSIFARVISFQSKYFNESGLNALFRRLGCNRTAEISVPFQDVVKNNTIIELVQIVVKYINEELKKKTDVILIRNQSIGPKIEKLLGGHILNLISEVVLNALNEMSGAMSKSPFVTEPPKLLNFFPSALGAVIAGAMKAVKVFKKIVGAAKP